MEQVDLDRINQQYAKLSDLDLIAAFDAGAEGHSDPEVWKIVVAEYVRRRMIANRPAVSLYDERAQPRSVGRGPSRWFVLGRLLRCPRWDPGDRLPVNFFYFTIALVGLPSLVFIAYGVLTPDLTSTVRGLIQTGVVLLFVLAVDRSKPWGWYYILACYISYLIAAYVSFLHLWPTWDYGPSIDSTSVVVLALIHVAIGLMVSLYVVRRRAQFGLPGWDAVL